MRHAVRLLNIAAATAACVLAVLGTSRLAAADASGRPNIVVIVADDLGWADVGYHGSSIRTPVLDRLAREGVRLEQHYVAPMCSPTRAGLLSGRYWSRFGVTAATNSRVFPFETVTLASALKSAGYDTALMGKWHLGSNPDWGPHKFGFDHSYGSLAGGVGPLDHRYKTGPFTRTWHRNGKLLEEKGHVTDLIAGEAIRWIESRGERPFFLYIPFTAVHIPIDEPQRWPEMYPEIEDLGAREYAACLTHMDDSIGQILEALERAGKRENTLVVFFSDNGATPGVRNDDPKYPGEHPPGKAGGSNLPLRGKKTQLYEGGIRVPALAHWPGRLQPRELHTPIHVVDWTPTLTRLAGYEPSADLRWDGADVWPVLTGEATPEPRSLYWAGVGFRSAAVREGDWKLIVHTQPQEAVELFDLARDPNETTNLADRDPAQVERLRKVLAGQQKRDRDAVVND